VQEREEELRAEAVKRIAIGLELPQALMDAAPADVGWQLESAVFWWGVLEEIGQTGWGAPREPGGGDLDGGH